MPAREELGGEKANIVLLCLDHREVPVPNVLHFHHGVGTERGDVGPGHNFVLVDRRNRARQIVNGEKITGRRMYTMFLGMWGR
jgi:hypothetical protein